MRFRLTDQTLWAIVAPNGNCPQFINWAGITGLFVTTLAAYGCGDDRECSYSRSRSSQSLLSGWT